MPVKQNNNIDNFEFDKNSYNILYTSPNTNTIKSNINDDILKEKNRQIKELQTKIDYYNE